jgi:hypothetical protein
LKKINDQERKKGPTEIDEILARIWAQMNLDRETEHEVLEEIRSHLEEVVAEAQSQGADEAKALAQAADCFGVEEVGTTLQEVHAGWGTADAVIAAGLPVVCALVLRWLVFTPDGTALGWHQVLARPAFMVVAAAALLVPVLKFERWRYALVSWGFFWLMTVIFLLGSTVRW